MVLIQDTVPHDDKHPAPRPDIILRAASLGEVRELCDTLVYPQQQLCRGTPVVEGDETPDTLEVGRGTS